MKQIATLRPSGQAFTGICSRGNPVIQSLLVCAIAGDTSATTASNATMNSFAIKFPRPHEFHANLAGIVR